MQINSYTDTQVQFVVRVADKQKCHLNGRQKKKLTLTNGRDGGKSYRMIFTYQTACTPLKSQGYQVARNEEHKKHTYKINI